MGAAAGIFVMISRTDVIEAYRTVLGRDPENEQTIDDNLSAATVAELYNELIESEEFKENFWKDDNNLPGIAKPVQLQDQLHPSSFKFSQLHYFNEAKTLEARGFRNDPELAEMLSFFDTVQRQKNIRGCIGEIGVANRAFFVPLALCCREDEIAVAIDVFDQLEHIGILPDFDCSA